MTPLYIFDLDGTLANIEHRLHHVRLRKGSRVKMVGSQPALYGTVYAVQCDATGEPVGFEVSWDSGYDLYAPAHGVKLVPNWDAFHAACVNDEPIPEMVELLKDLYWQVGKPNEIWIWSGRSDTVRQETIKWLIQQDLDLEFSQLKMRPAGDTTPDDVLKESWLHAMDPADRARLRMVFDDRSRVVDMWRRNGVRCLQVAPGNF